MGILDWLSATLPILLLLTAMSVFKLGTEKAALLGLLAAVLTGFAAAQAPVPLLGAELLKGAWNALSILIVIWPAIFLYETLRKADAFSAIQRFVDSSSRDQLLQILVFSWLFSSFLQGVTGFGVPVAVCAPLLAAIGVKPIKAVVITLLGHAWANTYGTLALAWDALVSQSGVPEVARTALYTAAMLWLFNLASGCIICLMYGGGKALRHMLPFVLFVSAIQGGGQLLCSQLNTTIAAFLPTTIALVAVFAALRLGWYAGPWSLPSKLMQEGASPNQAASGGIPLGGAAFPFLLLGALSVLILLVKPVNQVLYRVSAGFAFGATETGKGFVNEATAAHNPIHFLTHAGFILLLVVLVTYTIYRGRYLPLNALGGIWQRTCKKTIPASLGILFLVMMAQVLKGTGQMEVLAQGVSQASGGMYGLLAPFVGILGAFVTSSNTSSNILLGEFQYTTAGLLGMSGPVILMAQTVGGAIGTVIGPSTILLGTTTVGCKGEEGTVLRTMLPIALAEVAVVGVAVLLLTL